MSLNFNNSQPISNLTQLTETLKDNINCGINCCKVAKVIEFNAEDFTVKCSIMNKKLTGLNKDGSQKLSDYPVIYARLHTLGWGNIGVTHPIVEGQEGLLLFNDRELETWFLTGDTGLLKYDRTHDMTDAIFICGVHSKPNVELTQYLDNCINLYYKQKNIQINENGIIINGNTTINGNLTVNGAITATGDIKAGNVSLQSHVHSGVTSGDSNTGKPVA